jgi:hypothetical protein
MAPGLAARFPRIKTYRGYEIANPLTKVRFSWTLTGLQAMVFSDQEVINIEPATPGSVADYISYYKSDGSIAVGSFQCRVSRRLAARSAALPPLQAVQTSAPVQLRTYRLAVTSTTPFTKATARNQTGTVSTALAAIANIVNYVNEIYERDLAIHFELVENEDKLIFTTPKCSEAGSNSATCDPFNDGDGEQMIDVNTGVIDRLIGNNGYDIGHVFGSDGGGVAGGNVCENGYKGAGASNPSSTVFSKLYQSYFAVDYVAVQWHGRGLQWKPGWRFSLRTGERLDCHGLCGRHLWESRPAIALDPLFAHRQH